VQIASRRGHVCTVQRDQTVRCWGDGSAGELGSGEFRDSTVAVPVVVARGGAPLAGVRAVRAGWAHTCALKADGTVWCWGKNDFGQLGTGTRGQSTATPAQTLIADEGRPLDRVIALAVGTFSACALREPGDLWCWGKNDHGQLGTGDTTDRDVATAAKDPCR
jgi:alpha-tubulin suppressor-like RCC1 family protein